MAARRRFRWPYAVLVIVALGLFAWVLFHKKPAKPVLVPVVPVAAVRASLQDIPISITALGSAQAWTSDTILSQVSGKLLSVNFTEGAEVKAGQLLALVDPAPYRAALTQAEGAMRRDRALLAGARIDLERYRILAAQDSIARQTYDDQAALVRQDEEIVQVDEGAVASARVNLGWCRIVSPISGRAGVRLVDPGNLVSASGSIASTPNTAAATSTAGPPGGGGGVSATLGGSVGGTGIVVINQVRPIAVTFTVPEGDFQRLSDLSDRFRRALATQASSQETGAPLDNGELRIADNRVDPATGTIELKARFPNAGGRLWPGQFVNVQLTLQTLRGAVTIPATAVTQGPGGAFVYVVGADRKVAMRPVAIAWTQGTTAIVQSGVRAGETVVTDGQMTLKPGSTVRVVRSPPPAPPAS